MGPPPPEVQPGPAKIDETDIDILSNTIQKLRRDIIEQKKKTEHYKQQNRKLIVEKETLRKQLSKTRYDFKKVKSRKMSKAEKLKVVTEVLDHTKFTKVAFLSRVSIVFLSLLRQLAAF